MKKLIPIVMSLLAAAFVSCEKEKNNNDLKPNVIVVDATTVLVEYYATLSASDIAGGAKIEMFSSTKGDPKDLAGDFAPNDWSLSVMEQDTDLHGLNPGRHYYGFWSQTLEPGQKYYFRVKLTAGGEETWGALAVSEMMNPGAPYVRSSDLKVESTSAVATATWGANGQTIVTTGYLIAEKQEDLNDPSKCTSGNVSDDGKYHFDGLTPGKTYYTKLWCQTALPANPTKYHISGKTYSAMVYFKTKETD